MTIAQAFRKAAKDKRINTLSISHNFKNEDVNIYGYIHWGSRQCTSGDSIKNLFENFEKEYNSALKAT